MAVEPFTLAAFIVATTSTITATAAIGVYRYVRKAYKLVTLHDRILRGENNIDDKGLVEQVREHRMALIESDHLKYRGGEGNNDHD